MKRNLLLVVLAAALIGAAIPAWGDSYVIAVPVGVGTPITSVPYTITKSGFYYLKKNLSATATGNAITVGVNEVTLDLMGFSLAGPSLTSSTGIFINPGLMNVEVRNGEITKFDNGISSMAGGSNHRLATLKVTGCNIGIRGDADGIIITGCQAVENVTGIMSGASGVVIDGNTATYNGTAGFLLNICTGVITKNASTRNGWGFILGANPGQLVDHNASVQNTITDWVNLPGCTAGLNTP
jgi:hypothetical protein